jgi:hypothetical protein
VEVIQLSLWEDLKHAAVTPVNADFLGLLERLEAEILPLSTITEKLDVAGEAILRLGEIYGNRAEAALEEIEYLGDREKEPVLPLNAFDCYLRQSMMVDLGQFIETPELPEVEREYHRVSVVRELSVAEALAEIADALRSGFPTMEAHQAEAAEQVVDPELEIIELSHPEIEPELRAEIAQYVRGRVGVSIAELASVLAKSPVGIWLAVMGSYDLASRGQEFYGDWENVLLSVLPS